MISGRFFPVTVCPLDTVGDLKAKIDDIEDIRPECQRLFLGDSWLEDSMIAMEHIPPSSSLNMVCREFKGLSRAPSARYNRRLALHVFKFWEGRRLFSIDLSVLIGGKLLFHEKDFRCREKWDVAALDMYMRGILAYTTIRAPPILAYSPTHFRRKCAALGCGPFSFEWT